MLAAGWAPSMFGSPPNRACFLSDFKKYFSGGWVTLKCWWAAPMTGHVSQGKKWVSCEISFAKMKIAILYKIHFIIYMDTTTHKWIGHFVTKSATVWCVASSCFFVFHCVSSSGGLLDECSMHKGGRFMLVGESLTGGHMYRLLFASIIISSWISFEYFNTGRRERHWISLLLFPKWIALLGKNWKALK